MYAMVVAVATRNLYSLRMIMLMENLEPHLHHHHHQQHEGEEIASPCVAFLHHSDGAKLHFFLYIQKSMGVLHRFRETSEVNSWELRIVSVGVFQALMLRYGYKARCD